MKALHQVLPDNLSARVYAQIRSALIDGEFAPGDRLRIKDLAEQLGTSITPVREAIFRLVSERALELKASTAIYVPILAPDDLRQFQLMRMQLEGAAAERACARMTPEQLTQLEELQERFIVAAASDVRQASLLNRQFHFQLMSAANMPLLTATVENMWVIVGPLLQTFHRETPQREFSGRNHKHYQVLRALRQKDCDAARLSIQEDIRWGETLIQWLERQLKMRAEAEA